MVHDNMFGPSEPEVFPVSLTCYGIHTVFLLRHRADWGRGVCESDSKRNHHFKHLNEGVWMNIGSGSEEGGGGEMQVVVPSGM